MKTPREVTSELRIALAREYFGDDTVSFLSWAWMQPIIEAAIAADRRALLAENEATNRGDG